MASLIQEFAGAAIAPEAAGAFLARCGKRNTYLIQECLEDQPALADLATVDRAITLRVITEHRGSTIHAIAWDFVLTASGPRLLEGNTCWGVFVPQWLSGGLVSGE